jgi:hypothetical protein
MGDRIKTRQQLLDEQADGEISGNAGDKRPEGSEHPDQPRAALWGADSAL